MDEGVNYFYVSTFTYDAYIIFLSGYMATGISPARFEKKVKKILGET
ncbi:MAG: hypothetical protein MPEBLZ_00659 [Candidatus Methanoperedens nitroreducens]|uniref:Uncharacterized protein n=1 Tax=Candidatus Methanoperedens nitratireducens TaxID=1392998 RepID=A0A0P8CMP1_9EURY|nr:MAG: hypothetical protein MPEBLZ_00659 [Candidatus Methanoperedens sp. BLZ1]